MPAAGAPAAPDPMAGGMGADPMAGVAPAPGADPTAMGAMPGADPMAAGGAMPGADPAAMGADPMAGGDPAANGAGFDMGIGMTPDEDPKKYIEGAVAKVATELRKYQQGLPKPDMELNKTAVNTIAAATKTALQPNQVDELMTSYADAMRREGGEGSDGNEGGGDMGADAGAMGGDPMAGGGDMGGDPAAMGGDPMAAGGDAGAGAEQAPLQERFNKVLKEFFQRRQEEKGQNPKGEIEQIDQRDSFSRKPFTAPVSK